MRFAVCLSLAVIANAPARADVIPGMASGTSSDYFSLDSSPVHVDFTQAKSRWKVELNIPRKYIVFANIPRQNPRTPLPDNIATNHINIAFSDPDGEAWNEVVAKRAADLGIAPEFAAKQLRPQQYIVRLNVVTNPNRRAAHQAGIAMHERQRDRYQGLIHYKFISNDIYVGDESDDFESISCFGQLNPIYFCTYTIEISSDIVASASFLDFRLHGGRAYANKRANFLREVVCRFTDECKKSSVRLSRFIGDQKIRVCTKYELPSKEVAIGFSRNITPNMPIYKTRPEWFEEVKDLFWRLRIPSHFSTSRSFDRPDITVAEASGFFLYPQFVPSAPISARLRWELGASAPSEEPPPRECTEYMELSLEEMAERDIQIKLTAPVHRSSEYGSLSTPQQKCAGQTRVPERDFDVFIACKTDSGSVRFWGPDETYPRLSCPIFSSGSGNCTLAYERDGWPVWISFREVRKSDWRTILEGANAFLDKATISRDVIRIQAGRKL